MRQSNGEHFVITLTILIFLVLPYHQLRFFSLNLVCDPQLLWRKMYRLSLKLGVSNDETQKCEIWWVNPLSPKSGQEERWSPKEEYFDLQVILVRTSVWRISMWMLGFKRITANNAKRPITCNYNVNCRHDDIRYDTRFLSTGPIWASIGVNTFPR